MEGVRRETPMTQLVGEILPPSNSACHLQVRQAFRPDICNLNTVCQARRPDVRLTRFVHEVIRNGPLSDAAHFVGRATMAYRRPGGDFLQLRHNFDQLTDQELR